MALQAGDGEWAVVDNVNVGYGGTGPGNALSTLTGLGLDRQLAWNIAYSRVSDVRLADLAATDALHSNDWPHVRLGEPIVLGDHFVVHVDADGQGQHVPDPPVDLDLSGQVDERTHLQRWLDVLDLEEPPEWIRGSRRARVYLDRAAAEADGFVGGGAWSRGGRGPYPVILEQGELQLWLDLPESNDPSQLFTPETYAVLRAAGFFVDDLESRDARGAFWRWLSTLGHTRPAFVDLEDMPLRHPLPVDLQGRR